MRTAGDRHHYVPRDLTKRSCFIVSSPSWITDLTSRRPVVTLARIRRGLQTGCRTRPRGIFAFS
jgi:hypothetical protein